MKIGYMGDGPWAHQAFKRIIEDSTIEIKFVTVRYDKQDSVLMELAQKNEIPVELSRDVNSEEFISKVKEYEVDLLVSMSFNQIFKKKLIHTPKYKIINCHAGKLPFYRGRNILNWVLINDEKEFGITVHYVDEGIDTGDIILQEVYPITDEDDYGSLLERAYEGCADVLYQSIKLIQNNKVKVVKQREVDEIGMYCGMRMPGDEIINWNQSSRDIFNFVRAISSPGPGARSWVDGEEIIVNKVKMVEGSRSYINIPGQVIGKTNQGVLIKTKDTIIEITDYFCNRKLKIGDRLKNYE